MHKSNQQSLQLLAQPEAKAPVPAVSRKRAADEIDEYTDEAHASEINDLAMAKAPAKKPSASDATLKRSKIKRLKTSMTNGLPSVADESPTEVKYNAVAMDETDFATDETD